MSDQTRMAAIAQIFRQLNDVFITGRLIALKTPICRQLDETNGR
jgi:hypothetical protein